MGPWRRGESTDPVTRLKPPPLKRGGKLWDRGGAVHGPCDQTVTTTCERGGSPWDRGEGDKPRSKGWSKVVTSQKGDDNYGPWRRGEPMAWLGKDYHLKEG